MTQISSHALELVLRSKLVAILRLEDLSSAVELTRALLKAGICAVEFTLTNPAALDVVPLLKSKCPEFDHGQATVGIGSVRNPREAKAALDAGAQFIVSPITRIDVLDLCKEAAIPCMPGAMTPTEIATAWEAGASIVKVFPAKGLGPGYLRDVLAPMPYLKLMPTGGVDLENLGTYFKCGAVAVGIGSNLLDMPAMNRGDWDTVAQGAARYVHAIQQHAIQRAT